jgi:DNA-directed RNA polymerase specialized sigma24 family protein
MSPKETVHRLLERRTDPMEGWPAKARAEHQTLLRQADTVLATLSPTAQRVAFYRYTLRHSVDNTARLLDLSVCQVHGQLARVHTRIAQALGLCVSSKGGSR